MKSGEWGMGSWESTRRSGRSEAVVTPHSPLPIPALLRRFLVVAVTLAGPLACARAQSTAPSAASRAFARADTARLHRVLDSLAAAHHGVTGYAVENLDTGERLALRGDETFPTASLIKVPVLVTVYDLVAKGTLSLDDPLTLLNIDKVPGDGTLQFMHSGLSLSVRDAVWLMITTSDNTATNLLLDRIVIRRVWDKMESLGLKHTKVHSKTFLRSSSVAMDSSVKYGLGVTTPNEMASLFALLARGKAVSPAADSAMLDVLEHNQDGTLLQRYLDGVRAAHKTGATDAVRTECSLFYLQSRVVACVMTRENADQRWILDSEPQLTMARMGQAIVAAWPRGEGPKQ
ncbi:MAG TPA: serine hydrolase [Gemmatimonadaceae bacterium]|nr:serine hydrolase [Gemmatimonadaceae bacterium]